jgi:hypothetical protein
VKKEWKRMMKWRRKKRNSEMHYQWKKNEVNYEESSDLYHGRHHQAKENDEMSPQKRKKWRKQV